MWTTVLFHAKGREPNTGCEHISGDGQTELNRAFVYLEKVNDRIQGEKVTEKNTGRRW